MLQHKAEDELAYLQKMKTYKKIRYIHEDIYQQFIVDRQFEELQANLLNNKLAIQDGCLCKKDLQVDNQVRQLNTHVRRKDYYLEKGDNNALYYDESIYTDSLFYILVKTNKSKVDIKNIFSYTEYFGFGARHSVGKNSFKLVGIEEVGYKRNNEYKVLLSQSILDDTFVLDQSYYQIDSKKYHPSFTYINKTTHRMNLFNEGSYFKVKGSKEWVGKLLTFEINDKPLYYYAIGYII